MFFSGGLVSKTSRVLSKLAVSIDDGRGSDFDRFGLPIDWMILWLLRRFSVRIFFWIDSGTSGPNHSIRVVSKTIRFCKGCCVQSCSVRIHRGRQKKFIPEIANLEDENESQPPYDQLPIHLGFLIRFFVPRWRAKIPIPAER